MSDAHITGSSFVVLFIVVVVYFVVVCFLLFLVSLCGFWCGFVFFLPVFRLFLFCFCSCFCLVWEKVSGLDGTAFY